MLSNKETKAALNAIDDAYHDPFSGNFLNSINKIHAVIQKTKMPAALLSFLKNALFSLNQGDLNLEDFAKQKLKDITIPLVDMKTQVVPHLRKEMASDSRCGNKRNYRGLGCDRGGDRWACPK